ncbi:hypothetical protein HN014_22425 (plasmid) [Aquimarina sp. TRL1]|uniref:hypothetical protein n=1 Tax=Aquimarina sp. (strain TRL1) TaxID=2736252 RepID=UPI00158D8F3A|nr:hypothetical protein [Aquimarina sp. TRL1]QKX07758.1 hypothetical protein HN014_22425 [Aquimarina sp. TRL1]
MKKQIYWLTAILGILPCLLSAQIPVTDAAAGMELTAINLQITLLNQNINQANLKLSNLNNKVENTNKKLTTSNDHLKKLSDLKEEEINSYKNAPDNRLVSYQKRTLMSEKKQIVNEIRNVLNWMGDLKHITEREKSKVEKRFTKMVLEITIIWTQTNDLLNANDSIIPANERQTMLEETLRVFKKYIGRIQQDESYLKMINAERKSRVELIGF